MKIVRYLNGAVRRYGVVDGDRVHPLIGSPFGDLRWEDASVPLGQVELLVPVEPTKVLCVGANYRTYSLSGGVPTFSMKVPTTWTATGQPVMYPRSSEKVIMEAELAIVIGSAAKDVDASQALAHVLGLTVANDFTARDLMREDGRPCRAKNFDGFCPIGPCIETNIDHSDLRIWGRVNGEIVQQGTTRDMIATVPEVVSMFSEVMTLCPGDVILTATPSPPPYVHPGDVVEAEIQDVGVLRNTIISSEHGRLQPGEWSSQAARQEA